MTGNSVHFQVDGVGYLRIQSLQFTAACPAGRCRYCLGDYTIILQRNER